MDTNYSRYAQLASTMPGDTIVIPSSQLRKMRQVEAYILSSIDGIAVKERHCRLAIAEPNGKASGDYYSPLGSIS